MSDNLPARRMGGLIPAGDEREALRWTAELLARSGYFRDAQGPAQAAVKVLMGREVGLSPLTSVMGFHVIEGKPEFSAQTMALLVKRSGRYRYRVVEHSPERCELAWFERDGDRWEPVGPSSFSIDEARTAKLVRGENSNWVKWPKAMLFARALSSGVHMHAPDVLGGAGYVEEEIGGVVSAPAEGRVDEGMVYDGEVEYPQAEPVPQSGVTFHPDEEPELPADPPESDPPVADAPDDVGPAADVGSRESGAETPETGNTPDDPPPPGDPEPDPPEVPLPMPPGEVRAEDWSKRDLARWAHDLGVDEVGTKQALAERINAARQPRQPEPRPVETPTGPQDRGDVLDARDWQELLDYAYEKGAALRVGGDADAEVDEEYVLDLVGILTAPRDGNSITARGADSIIGLRRGEVSRLARAIDRAADDPDTVRRAVDAYRSRFPLEGQEQLGV